MIDCLPQWTVNVLDKYFQWRDEHRAEIEKANRRWLPVRSLKVNKDDTRGGL